VHTPDLYEGRTFDTLDDGIAHAQAVGFDAIVDRGRAALADLPADLVYMGFSLGILPAQTLAQERPGARGAVLLHGSVPAPEWPAGVPLQLHTMADDDLGDADVAEELAATVPEAELFLYPGDRHLFTDRSLPAYDADAAALVLDRVRRFLATL
jgi:dienelactone hydrolase